MAAAAVLQNAKPSGPFPHKSLQHINDSTLHASTSRSQPPSAFSGSSSPPPVPETTSKAFHRFRSSLEQSLRTATRSKKTAPPPIDEFAGVAQSSKGKEKEKVSVEEVPRKGNERTKMLRKLGSGVTFRRGGRESISPAPPPLPTMRDAENAADKVRAAGFTSFVTPSMRQGSMSSPSLHLSSQAIPSPKSRPAIPASSSSNSDAVATPTRERVRRASLQPSQVSPPAPLGTRRDTRATSHAVPGANQQPGSRHRATKSVPLALASPPSAPSTPRTNGGRSRSPETPTPTQRSNNLPSPPGTPTPATGSRSQLSRSASRPSATSSGHLPLNTPPASPITARTSSPIRARSPSTRSRVVTPQGLRSSSATHLPIIPSSSSPTPRRPSGEVARRPSIDTRKPSVDSPRRASIDTPQASHDSPSRSGNDSPSPRPRPISPGQRAYSQNRHFNISSVSLSGPSNPEHRELIRTAISMLCKEVIKIPLHMSRSESGIKDWEEVEVRMRALVRLERILGKSGGTSGGSSSNLNMLSGMSSSGLSSSGEEREKRLFCDALKDGFVLCQFMNKLRSASIVRPDAREDGFTRTSNVTKFLAACASYGLPDEDIFQRDDLIEGTSESLARVAKTIVSLMKFVETPIIERSKFISGQRQGSKPTNIITTNVYSQGGGHSQASASTPNLVRSHTSTSPTPTSPMRKRYSPPSGLPPVRSDSPDVLPGKLDIDDLQLDGDDDNVREIKFPPVPHIMPPPPRSPLRARPSQRVDDGGLFTWAKSAASPPRTYVADSIRPSSDNEPSNARQSVASSAMTETTMTTEVSSILDFGRKRTTSSGYNKFGTIRTMTTDVTSEAPSMTRTEGSAIADELARKTNSDIVGNGGKYHRDRKSSEAPMIDLTRVVEEADESASSSKGRAKDKAPRPLENTQVASKPEKPAVHLRKGKWPDDFIDAFQNHSPTRAITPKSSTPDQEDRSANSTPISISPPRKLAIVGVSRRNDSLESVPQFPRRPTHRARHSVDAPVLLPKESGLARDGSPDSIIATSGRVILRRHSTKPSMPKNGVYLPRSDEEPRHSDEDSPVPFPRTTSAEHGAGSSSPHSANGGDTSVLNERPRVPRGRFQSDIDSSARRRARPSSYDELGANPTRSRFESMVNLGVASNNASASDLLSRDSVDGSVVRKTLIVREEGKPPTHFQLGNCIGRGQFGSVYRALNLNTGQMVAVKRIRLEGLKEEEVTTLMREVNLVKSLSHPSIVKYEGMARDDDTLSIILEYAENGSLGQTLKAFGKLNERLVASYVVKILEGLHYLHQSDVVHCDLKAANILTTKNGNVKLSDFGVSLNLRAMEREIKDVAGTPNWMAPEVIELKGASTKSDIWSLACTVIELLTGRPPYADVGNSMSVMFRIVEDDMPPIPDGCSQPLQDFLTRCFNKDPTKRPSADLLCEHPWLKKNWGAHKELRPQDSIPFLRRVSADLQKSEVVRYLSQIEMPQSPVSESFSQHADDFASGSPPGRHMYAMQSMADNNISPREHSFVKTTFSKPMICRVCLLNVKKSAVLCAQCSLISHAKCAVNAPPTCDLRAQLLLYAKYAEQGNPSSVYHNPADALRENLPVGPSSDVPYIAHSPRTSIDAPSPPPHTPTPLHSVHPPTAYKILGAFKRSRSNLTPEPTQSVPSSAYPKPKDDKIIRKKTSIVIPKKTGERPQSFTSNSTDLQSVRSIATAAESFSSRRERKSTISSDKGTRKSASGLSAGGNSDAIRSSKLTSMSGVSEIAPEPDESKHDHIPGSMPVESRRHRKRESKSSGNCTVQ